MSQPKILLIEDESAIREMISLALAPAGFEVSLAENVPMAFQQMKAFLPDLMLIDWMLPGTSGIEFIQKIKQDPKLQNIAIILLTARAEESNKLLGFESGADDYVTKPFSVRELIARIKSVLKRNTPGSSKNFIQVQQLSINKSNCQVKINNDLLELTPNEYRLLLFFCEHPNKVYSREQLINQVWKNSEDLYDRAVDAQIKRLRQRLKPYGYDKFLQTIREFGYQWSLD